MQIVSYTDMDETRILSNPQILKFVPSKQQTKPPEKGIIRDVVVDLLNALIVKYSWKDDKSKLVGEQAKMLYIMARLFYLLTSGQRFMNFLDFLTFNKYICTIRILSLDSGSETGQFGLAQAINEAFEVARDLLITGSGERHTIVRQSSSADLPSQEDDAPGSSQVQILNIVFV